jgi:hypothetical protein
MGIVGGAIMTPLMGWISVSTQSVAKAYLVPLAGYFFVALYAYVGATLKPRISTGTPETLGHPPTIARAIASDSEWPFFHD